MLHQNEGWIIYDGRGTGEMGNTMTRTVASPKLISISHNLIEN